MATMALPESTAPKPPSTAGNDLLGAAPAPVKKPPLALAGAMGGQSQITPMQAQPAAQPSAPVNPAINTAQTADPLAFQSNTNTIPQTPSTLPMGGTTPPVNTSVQAPTPAAPAASKSLSDMSEQEKAQYWAGQFQNAGMYGTVGGGTTGITNNPATGKVDQSAAIAGQNALAQAGAANGVTQQVQGAQTADLAARNAASNATNLNQAGIDADANIASLTKAGGVGTPDELAKIRATLMRQSGFDADGGFLGAPDNNPNATPGLPSNYDPSKPVQPNNGSVDDQGNYHTDFAPEKFIEPTRPLLPSDKPNTNPIPGGGSTAVTNAPANPTNALDFSTSEINPDDNLLTKLITPGAGVDRYSQAMAQLENYKKATDSRFKADARDTNRYNFGAGRGVSGEARTSQGNLLAQRENDLDTKGFDFLNNALTGSINDSYRNIDEAQQERDFQRGERDTAFDNEARTAELRDRLINSDFDRNARREDAGYRNSPENIQLILSSIFGDQASAAGKAAAQAFANAGKGSSGGGGNLKWLYDLYSKYKGGGGGDASGGYVDTPVDDGRSVA